MQAPLYDLYITGKLVEGVSSTDARDDLARLFNTNADKVARYVSGQPALFKRGIDKAAAMKYKAALHQVGILVTFKSHPLAAEGSSIETAEGPTNRVAEGSSIHTAEGSSMQTAEGSVTRIAEGSSMQTAEGSANNTAESSFIQTDEGSVTETAEGSSSGRNIATGNPSGLVLSLAVAGSDVLLPEEKSLFVAVDIDTSAIRMVSVFSELEPPASVGVASPDTSHMSIAAAGVNLLEDKPEPPPLLPPLPLDLDSMSLAPAGATLQQLTEKLPALPPNTDALAMAPAGADLLEGEQQPTPPPAPDTSHLSMALPIER